MKKIFKRIGIVILVICIGCMSYFAYWWFLDGGEQYYRYTYHKNHEPFTFRKETNTDALYSESSYEQLMHTYLDTSEDVIEQAIAQSYIVPGLKATRTIEGNDTHTQVICTSMTPQGITMSEQYVFISAYCCTKQHNSVIYVLDRETHDFIKEIILPDKSHVGSIAYDTDKNNLWVCCYEEDNKVAFVCAFSLEEMENYNFDNTFSPIKYSLQYPIDTQKRSSFMNYYDGALYIGYFASSIKAETTIQEFKIKKDGGLKTKTNLMSSIYDDEPDEYALPTSLFYINGNAQGLCLDDTYIVITQSSGSQNRSSLKIFSHTKNLDGNVDARDYNFINALELPVMAEGCYMDEEGNIYVCFESSAYAYRARKSEHVDRIMCIPRSVYEQ